jgi:hypothetical protein
MVEVHLRVVGARCLRRRPRVPGAAHSTSLRWSGTIKDRLQLPIDPLARYKSNNPGRLIVIVPGTPAQVWPRSPPFPLVGWGRREVGRGDGGSGTKDGGWGDAVVALTCRHFLWPVGAARGRWRDECGGHDKEASVTSASSCVRARSVWIDSMVAARA